MAQIEKKVGVSNRMCCVCKERSGTMFSVPKNAELLAKWKEQLSFGSVKKHMQICYRHFKPEDIQKGNGWPRLVKDAKPIPYSRENNEVKASHSVKSPNATCVVPGCGKKAENGVTLHMFPRFLERRRQWASLFNLKKVPSRWTLICSDHFLSSDFHAKGQLKTLKASATPSIIPSMDTSMSSRDGEPEESPDASHGESYLTVTEGDVTSECVVAGDNFADMASEIVFGSSHDDLSVSNKEGTCEESCAHEINVADNVDHDQSVEEVIMSAADEKETEVLKSVFEALSSTIKSDIDNFIKSSCTGNSSVGSGSTLQSTVSSSCTESVEIQTDSPKLTLFDLLQTDIQLKAFTGLTFANLNCLIKLMSELHHDSKNDKVPMKNKILLTLCKLRLNLSYECLGVLVGIDRRRCGEYFASTVKLLATVLKHTIFWPSKEEVLLNMPKCFAKYKDTRIILDCTEVPVISPDCLKCRIRLYSHYKKCHTVKILVGVAPSGLITFLSKVYGGRTSDKQIFEESVLISENLLEPYVDAVMVDKGFRIDSICEERGIKIHRPPFIVKKQPLSEANARRNAEIASARVHVERVMQRLKIFRILQSKIAWSLTPYLDDIFVVIAGLVSLSPPILSDDKFLTYKKI